MLMSLQLVVVVVETRGSAFVPFSIAHFFASIPLSFSTQWQHTILFAFRTMWTYITYD